MLRANARAARRSALLALAALAVALTVAACGGGDKGSGSTGASTDAASTTKAATGTPLKVGALINVTGPTTTGEENAPPVLEGWARAVNAQGGVAGHPIEIDVVDTKGDAPTASAAVQRMARDDAVVAVLLYDASTEGVVARAITKAGLPVIGGIGYNPTAWGALPNWLPIATTFPAVIDMGMVLGKEAGATKTVFPVCSENSSCGAAGPLAERASKALGMDYAGTLPVSVSSPDYTAQCLKIKSSGVDYVMLGLTTAASFRLVRDCRTQGYDGKWGLFDGSVWPKVMNENDPGVPVEIAISAFPWYVDDAPVAAYRDMMDGAGVAEDNWGSPQGTAAYATMELFRKALESGKLPDAPTRADVIQAYGSIRGETLDGLLPQPITFHPNRPEPLVNCFWTATYDGGRFSGTQLGRPTCDPPEVLGAK